MRTVDVPRLIAAKDGAAFVVNPHFPAMPAPIDRIELAWVLALDVADQVVAVQRVGMGGCSTVAIPIPVVLSVPLLAHVDRFALVHSHPVNLLTPSEEDKALTRAVLNAATVCGLTLTDHYIIGPNGHALSLVETRVLAPPLRPAVPVAAT
jgi:DNA repair protein RadC